MLPKSWASILDVLLDLALLPANGRVAEVRCKDVIVRQCDEANIDLPFLAAAHTVDCSLHIVVNAATRHTAKDTKALPAGVKEHLVRLQQVGPDQKNPAVRQLEVCNLKLRMLATDHSVVFTPIELECFAGRKDGGTNMPRPAVMVEELMASAATLDKQSALLREQMRRFRTGASEEPDASATHEASALRRGA